MHARIVKSRAATYARQRAEAEHRQTDELEKAKTLLRRRGWHVFDASVLGREWFGLGLIMVGTTPRTAQEVIQMAARFMA